MSMTQAIHCDSNNTSIQALIEQLKDTFSTQRSSFNFLENLKKSFSASNANLPTQDELLSLISNEAVSGALFAYYRLKASYPALVPEDDYCMDQLFYKTLYHIIKLEPTQIFPSLTPDDSIYLRIYTSENKEIHLEVFYDCEDDEDVEAVVSVYDGKKLLLKDFGSVYQACNKIYHSILNKKLINAYQTTGLIAKPRTTSETDTQESPDYSTSI